MNNPPEISTRGRLNKKEQKHATLIAVDGTLSLAITSLVNYYLNLGTERALISLVCFLIIISLLRITIFKEGDVLHP